MTLAKIPEELEMENKPSRDKIVNIEGVEGETLFWHLKEWLVVEHTEDIQAHLDTMWQHYKDVTDERLMALVGALCIETSLDVLLGNFIENYELLRTDSDFTFSIKIKIARSMCLIPNKILNSCGLTRQVRNEFAHNLEISCFNHLEAKYSGKFEPYVREFNVRDRDWSDLVSLYRDLVSFTIAALTAYSFQLRALKSYLKTNSFREHFRDYMK